jgi:hypothetical protein
MKRKPCSSESRVPCVPRKGEKLLQSCFYKGCAFLWIQRDADKAHPLSSALIAVKKEEWLQGRKGTVLKGRKPDYSYAIVQEEGLVHGLNMGWRPFLFDRY